MALDALLEGFDVQLANVSDGILYVVAVVVCVARNSLLFEGCDDGVGAVVCYDIG